MINLDTTLFTVENNARTQINELGGVASGDTTFTVDSVANFSVGMICTLSDREYIQNSSVTERVRITGISGSDLTVTRNIDGLGAQTFENNQWITGANNAEPIAQLQNIVGTGFIPFPHGVSLQFNASNAFQTTTNVNLTTTLQVGDKIRWEHATTGGVRYGIVTAIDYNSTVANRTYIAIGGSVVLNESIVILSLKYSRAEKPFGMRYPFLADIRNGGLIGGFIRPTVTSNNLTVSISLSPTSQVNPSAATPVGVWIGGQLRWITSALSFTRNGGTSSLNMGSAELATREVDLFAYLQWNTTTSAVNLLGSRLPNARKMSDFVNSATDAKGALGIINYNANDDVVLVDRFSATSNSSNNFTATGNVYGEPVYETRLLTFTGVATSEGGAFTNAPTYNYLRYQITGSVARVICRFTLASTSGGSGRILFNLPINTNSSVQRTALAVAADDMGGTGFTFQPQANMYIQRYDNATLIANNRGIAVFANYPI